MANQKSKRPDNLLTKQFPSSTGRSLFFRNYLFFILGITLLLYARIFFNGLTNWDDDTYVLNNPYIRNFTLTNIADIFSTYYCGNYHPLSILNFLIGYQLGGTSAWPYQLMNLLLHLANTALVFFFIKSLLTLSGFPEARREIIAAITSLIFGIHTLNVESVAWVSENKNVLYTLFFLLSLIMYIRYISSGSLKNYSSALLLFFLALLSKGMAVSLAVTLIVVDFALGRKLLSPKLILEKVPFFLLAIVFGIIAIFAQKSTHSVIDGNYFSLYDRLSFASFGFIQYLLKFILPVKLSALYPYPDKIDGSIPFYFKVFPLITLAVVFIFYRIVRKSRLVITAALFFIANILLVLQIIPVGDAYMADRYFYVPSIGLALTAALAFDRYSARLRVIGVFYLILIGALTFLRIGIWKDSLTLWNDVLKKYTNNSKAWNNRGAALSSLGRYAEAIPDYDKALQIKPDLYEAILNRGDTKRLMHDFSGALTDYNNLSVLDPENPNLYNNRGVLKSETNNYKEAIADYNKALELKPVFPVAFNNRGEAKIKINDFEGAQTDCSKAIEQDHRFKEAYNNRGIARKESGDRKGAMEDFNKAISLDPMFADAYYNRTNLWNEMGEPERAMEDIRISIKLGKKHDEALIASGLLKMKANDSEAALLDFDAALKISPSYAAYMNRGVANSNLGRFKDAEADYSEAIKLDPKSSLAYMNRCNARMQKGKYREALTDINISLQLDPANGLAYINRGIVKFHLGDYTGAINDLDVALSGGENSIALYYRGYAMLKKGSTQGCADIRKAIASGFTGVGEEVKELCNLED